MKPLLVVIFAAAACAQGRFEFQPFAGYRFGGNLHSSETDPNAVQVSSSVTAGATFGYSAAKHLGVELLYSNQPSNLTLHQALVNVIFADQFEHSHWQPYVLFGVGVMHISGADSGGTKFSYDAGGGARYWVSKHVGMRIQARWVPTYLYSTRANTQCTAYGCSDKKEHDLNQGEVTVGWIIRFP